MKNSSGLAKRVISFLGLAAFMTVGAIVLLAVDLPGVTVEDDHPNGCVDCHQQTDDADYRLNVELKALEGHPDISAMMKTVPADCAMCHVP